MGVFFQDPDISKNIFRLPASPAINNTLGAYHPTSGTGSVNSAKIRFGVSEIFARERKRSRSAGNRVIVGEVRKTITVSLSRLMNSACASQIRPRSDSPSLRNARTDGHTDRQTDRQTPLLYIYRYANARERLLPSTHISVTRRSTRRRSRIVAKRDGPVEIASPRRTVASDFSSTACDGPKRDFGGLK